MDLRTGRRGAAATLVASLVLGGAAACTPAGADARHQASKEKLPAAAEFRTGTCRSAADPVLALARLAARDDGARTIPAPDRTELITRQRQLITLQPTAEPDLRAPLATLSTAIGFVRIRVDSKTYDPALLRGMDSARRQVQHRCVRG